MTRWHARPALLHDPCPMVAHQPTYRYVRDKRAAVPNSRPGVVVLQKRVPDRRETPRFDNKPALDLEIHSTYWAAARARRVQGYAQTVIGVRCCKVRIGSCYLFFGAFPRLCRLLCMKIAARQGAMLYQ